MMVNLPPMKLSPEPPPRKKRLWSKDFRWGDWYMTIQHRVRQVGFEVAAVYRHNPLSGRQIEFNLDLFVWFTGIEIWLAYWGKPVQEEHDAEDTDTV